MSITSTRLIWIKTGCNRTYIELSVMLEDSGVDAVMITTPTNLHAEQLVLAAEVEHVYCEKPKEGPDFKKIFTALQRSSKW